VRNTRAVQSRHLSSFLVLGAISVCALLTGCRPEGVAALPDGKVLYGSCDSCHGLNGEGRKEVSAPQIAGLPKWYVELQLTKFRTGMRGAHPDDPEGLRMRPMSRQMMSEFEIQTVADYVSKLKPVKAVATLTGGNAEEGKKTWATCQACHGPNGMGNEALKAPPLVDQHDWYLMTSLHKFKEKVRGMDNDAQAMTMRPMAMLLTDEQMMKNVVAYVGTLQR
jgi:cytochrome c oxidase subunit 2